MSYLERFRKIWNRNMNKISKKKHVLTNDEIRHLKTRWRNSFVKQKDIKLFLKDYPELIDYVEASLEKSAPRRNFKLNNETIYSVKDFIEWLAGITKGE